MTAARRSSLRRTAALALAAFVAALAVPVVAPCAAMAAEPPAQTTPCGHPLPPGAPASDVPPADDVPADDVPPRDGACCLSATLVPAGVPVSLLVAVTSAPPALASAPMPTAWHGRPSVRPPPRASGGAAFGVLRL